MFKYVIFCAVLIGIIDDKLVDRDRRVRSET
jgi:hypothetical protein